MAKFSSEEVLAKIASTRLLPLFNFADIDICKSVIRACYEAGVRAFELTNRDAKAFDVFRQLVPVVQKEMPELSLGAGTILDAPTAKKFIEAGADYIIAPNLDFSVGETCDQYQIPWIPGCFSPTEFQQAHNAGSPLIKLFPAGSLGPDYLKHILAPLRHLRVVVTGGVKNDADSVRSWLTAGAFAAGVGSQLFSREIIQAGNFSRITQTLNEIITGIKV